MPVSDIEHFHLGLCPCCDLDTAVTRGIVSCENGPEGKYLCKWTPECHGGIIAFLVSLFDDRLEETVSVGVSYFFSGGGFSVQEIGNYSWTPKELFEMGPLCDRCEVIGTDLATKLFRLLDEIWVSDPYLGDFLGIHNKGEQAAPSNGG
jgi:hypothetical protein